MNKEPVHGEQTLRILNSVVRGVKTADCTVKEAARVHFVTHDWLGGGLEGRVGHIQHGHSCRRAILRVALKAEPRGPKHRLVLELNGSLCSSNQRRRLQPRLTTLLVRYRTSEEFGSSQAMRK